eukprot:gnl/MRDRNA2_/MRDRNA2_97646_c0_seq1.p1 gnl/MRDRNA2_/MRDRNA2_97646_c0~~gnl/MRDRNA2_/MRDRNA2_97646_c0_seq1.p1  ORF type:complete len:489 (-),score=62.74 gnl/MRDRNA2_/MRDRNA2_97646_c0_seq1:41-1507(-)
MIVRVPQQSSGVQILLVFFSAQMTDAQSLPVQCPAGTYQSEDIALGCKGGESLTHVDLTPMGTANAVFKFTVDSNTMDLDVRVVIEAQQEGVGSQRETLGAANLQVHCTSGKVLVEKFSGTVLSQAKRESTVDGRMWSWSGERQGTGQLVEWLQIQGPVGCEAEVMVSNTYTSELVGSVSYKWSGVEPCPAFGKNIPGCTPCSEVNCEANQEASCDGSPQFTCVDEAGAGGVAAGSIPAPAPNPQVMPGVPAPMSAPMPAGPAPAVPSWSPTPATPAPAASPTPKTVVSADTLPEGPTAQTVPAVSMPIVIGFLLVVVGLIFLALCLTKISFAARRKGAGRKSKGATTRGLANMDEDESFYRTNRDSSNPYGVERVAHADSFDSRGNDSELALRTAESFASSNADEVAAARMAFGEAGPYGYQAVPGASPAPSLPDSERSLSSRSYGGGPPPPPPGLAPHKPSIQPERSTRAPRSRESQSRDGNCCIS